MLIDIEVYPDPEYCNDTNKNIDRCKFIDSEYNDHCNLFITGIKSIYDWGSNINLKCDECKIAYQKDLEVKQLGKDLKGIHDSTPNI